MEEQPTDKVYMWLVLLTFIAYAVIITFGIVGIQAYNAENTPISTSNPFTS